MEATPALEAPARSEPPLALVVLTPEPYCGGNGAGAVQRLDRPVGVECYRRHVGRWIREVRRVDPITGHRVREFYGDPLQWMSAFSGGRRLAKFNTNLNGIRRFRSTRCQSGRWLRWRPPLGLDRSILV